MPVGGLPPRSVSQLGAIGCQQCSARYDIVDGIPFVGDYEPADFVGLIEIVATGGQSDSLSIDYVRTMNRLLEGYHDAPDKAAFSAGHSDDMVRAYWWSHRYHEWLQVGAIIDGETIDGMPLLNVGAGMGIDAVRLVDAGACVTCIDYSPALVSIGQRLLPEADWIGGFSHLLPFQDETFDIVCANAALHHMRSVPHALREMLRVLKPGGWLFTTGDPVRSDQSDPEEYEFEVFNRHEAVLGGINEGIIAVGDIYDTLVAFRPDVEVEILADIVGGPEPTHGRRIQGGFNDQWVPLTADNVERLRKCFGSVSVRVRKNAPLAIVGPTQSGRLVSPGLLIDWIRAGNAYTQLARLAPADVVDCPFPGERQSWFDLLNGWMRPEPPFEHRQAFKRARWLLSIPVKALTLVFEAKVMAGPERRVTVAVNGVTLATDELSENWRAIRVPLASNDASAPMLFEVRLEDGGGERSFEENSFLVRGRRFECRVQSWAVQLGRRLKLHLSVSR